MTRLVKILLLISIISYTAFAEDKRFIDFALKTVHERNFNGCDEALLDLFKNAGGIDIRVMTDISPDLKNQIRITSVYGNKSDSVYLSAVITKTGKKCVAATTTIITDQGKSCTASLSATKAFEYKAETLDYVFTQNSGGVDLLLTPAGNSCVKIYQNMNTYKSSN